MKICISVITVLLAVGLSSVGLRAAPPDVPFTDVQLTRALGMGIMFEVRLGQGPRTILSDTYTTALGDIMQNAGFTAVSIRIDMKMFEESSGGAPNYTLSPEFMDDLQFVVDDTLRRGLIALIAPKGLEDGTQESTDKQVAWWSQIAGHFKAHSHRLLFRLLNEPLVANFPNGIADIRPLYQALVSAVRPSNPTRYVVIYAQRASATGPGATDFNIMPIPTNASPYLLDFHAISGTPSADKRDTLIGLIKQAWQFREATWVPVWSGAWAIGGWTEGWDLDLTRRVANEFGARQCSIPGIYLMFNGGDTSIYDISQDRNANGITNEWTLPDIPSLVTENGPYDWTPSYHPTADAQVNSNYPDNNYGTNTQLHCDGIRYSYLQFNVTRIPANNVVAAATLKVYCTTAVGDTIEIHKAGNAWNEDTITWNDKPVVHSTVYDSGTVTQSNTWYTFDVTGAVTSNGVYSFALQRTTSQGSTIFQARDPDLDQTDPQLILTLAPVAPVASFSAAPTNGGAPLIVTFADNSTGSITNRFWNFGDGTTTNTTATSLSHTYRLPGTNTVRLTASGAGGSSTKPQTNLIVATSVDTLGDGVPNWWRAQYFGGTGATTNASSCAMCDPDHDSSLNGQEYAADTNPTNALSFFRIQSITNSPSASLSFQSSASRTYTLYARTNLTSGGWSSVAGQSSITGTGGMMTLTNPPSPGPQRFFRVGVQVP